MIFNILAFLLGDIFLQSFAMLPTPLLVYGTLALVCALWLRWRCLSLLFACMLGFAFSYWYATATLSWSLPKKFEGKTIMITGYVASLPITDEWQTSFFFAPEKQRTLIKLALREAKQDLRVGDKWQFSVRLKRIHSTQNPGSFDYEAWALQKGLRASGYIVKSSDNKLLGHAWYHYPITQLRQVLKEKIQLYAPHSSTSPWLMALMIGERNGIPQEEWQVLRNTGTNHLMAIAGLHIGMLAALMHTLVSWCWRRVPMLALWLPAQEAGAGAALIMALLYSALAGFSIPTQRACIMLSIIIFILLRRYKTSSWSIWSLAMLVVLLINPLSVLTESFWLSFATIALIIYGMRGRLAPSGLWWKWGRVQWVIGFGLIPLSLAFFQECSLVSFLANCIAIPWLGFLILPLCCVSNLLVFIAPSCAIVLLLLADKLLAGLWLTLTWFAQLDFAAWHHALPHQGILICAILGILLLLVPAGFPGRWLGLVWLLPLFLYQQAAPGYGEVHFTLLDVGQGLSVVVQTRQHTLVYDAGPAFGNSINMGESVVLPYLRSQSITHINALVISHGDNDHIGGAAAIIRGVPVQSILTSVPEKLASFHAQYCLAGNAWEWDGVKFEFIYPSMENLALGNDSSCVLLVDNGYQRLLLTGDIEKYAEKYLLQHMGDRLAANILVAPHHGSKTSAVKEFVHAVNPQYVLYATGYRNRYRFPHQQVVARYAEIGTRQINSTYTGAIQFTLDRKDRLTPPVYYRLLHPRYWSLYTTKNNDQRWRCIFCAGSGTY